MLLTASGGVSGTFGNATLVPSNYKLAYSAGEVDLQHLATPAITLSAPAGSTRYLSNTTAAGAITGTVSNTAPSGSFDLAVALSSAGQLTASSFVPVSSTVTAGGSTTFSADLVTGSTVGSRTIQVTESDSNASPTSATTSSVNVTIVDPRTLSASSTVSFGRYLVNTLGSGSTAVTSTSGNHGTVADATLNSGPNTISSFSVTGNGALFNGSNTTGTPSGLVSLSRNFGATTGTQTGSVVLSEANGALSGEFAGGVNALTVSYSADPLALRVITNGSTTSLGTLHAGAAVSVTSNAFTTTGINDTTTSVRVATYGGARATA